MAPPKGQLLAAGQLGAMQLGTNHVVEALTLSVAGSVTATAARMPDKPMPVSATATGSLSRVASKTVSTPATITTAAARSIEHAFKVAGTVTSTIREAVGRIITLPGIVVVRESETPVDEAGDIPQLGVFQLGT